MKQPLFPRARLAAWVAALCCLGGTASAHVANNDITTTGSADNGNFHRYGWIDGTNATLGDSHHIAEGNFFTFHLNVPSFVDIGFAEISGNGGTVTTSGGLDPAFSLYSGLLPPLAHDDTPYDPMFGNTVDLAPAGHIYLPHDGYRDTIDFSATGGKPYTGQFDALGDWSMANEDAIPGDPGSVDGNWAKLKYLTHVNANVTTLGANLMPSGAVNDAPESLTHYPLPAGDYTIAAGGAACDSPSIAACTNPSLWGRVTFSATANITPSFTGGATSLTIPVNIAGANLKPNLRVSDTDTGQTETWTQATAPAHGKLSFSGATAASGGTNITAGGTITYKPTANYSGADSFAVRVGDGLSSSVRTFAVTVKPNTVPSYTSAVTALKLAQNYGSNLRALLTVSDIDTGQTETWSQKTAPQHGTLKFTNTTADSGSTAINFGGTVVYQPAANYTGADSFAIQVGDGMATTVRNFTVTVGANTAPAFTGTTTALTLAQNVASNLRPYLTVGDTDNAQTETWSQQTAPAHGKLTFSNATAWSGSANITSSGTIAYTPTTGYSGPDSFAVKVSDGVATAVRTLTVTVQPNTAPSFVGTTTALKIVQNSAAVNIKPVLNVSDTNHGQTLTWKQAVAPAHGGLVFTNATATSGGTNIGPGGTITYQPTAGYSGADSFTVQVGDGVASANRQFSVTVGPNAVPGFATPTNTLNVAKNGAAVNLKPRLSISDIDLGQTETWSVATAPANGTLVVTGATAASGSTGITPGGTLTYQPKANWTGSETFQIKVTDSLGGTATSSFTVNVK